MTLRFDDKHSPETSGPRGWELQLIEQLFGIVAVFAAFITLNPVVEALLRFILQLFAQDLVDLQTVAQRLPLAVDAQRDSGLFQAVDKFALPFPAAEHAHVKAHIAVLFLQIKLTFAGHRHHVGLPLQAVQRHQPVIQRQPAAHGIQAGGIVVIFLRLHIGAALNGLLHELQKQGAYLLNKAQTEQLVNIVLQPKKGGGHEVNKKWVGKDAARILETIGVHVPDTCRLAICEVPADHPFVLVEQMMPVLPIVRCQSFEQAVEDAVVAEHGNRHTASIFSKDVDHMTRFARVIETTIYVKNSATKAGVGIGGEGHCTMTIAGPTGEGITCAKSFCRRRRCMLAEGGLRII